MFEYARHSVYEAVPHGMAGATGFLRTCRHALHFKLVNESSGRMAAMRLAARGSPAQVEA